MLLCGDDFVNLTVDLKVIKAENNDISTAENRCVHSHTLIHYWLYMKLYVEDYSVFVGN